MLNAVKKDEIFMGSYVGGLSGAFIMVSEDMNIADAARRRGHISIKKTWL